MDMSPFEDLEVAAARLEASGAYRVLRRLTPRQSDPKLRPQGSRVGVVLDVETTGMDCARDEVIELAMVRFVYSPEGEVLGVQDSFQGLHQPSLPISPEITAITGIDDAMVSGHSLDLDAVGGFVAPAHIVLAHNAGFDRGFAERLHAYFSTKPWGCSMCEPPWREEGFEGQKLAYLAAESGFFYDRHRALNDCMATLELLARPLPRSGRSGLAALLAKARQPSWRIWAEQAPYEFKDHLRRRGYRWSDGGDGRRRSWWTEVADAALQDELGYLRQEVYQNHADIPYRRITAVDRYSQRL